MTQDTHDYAAALHWFEQVGSQHDGSEYGADQARSIIHAIKIAQKLAQEPSEGMIKQGTDEKWWGEGAEDVFTAMRDQLYKEIE